LDFFPKLKFGEGGGGTLFTLNTFEILFFFPQQKKGKNKDIPVQSSFQMLTNSLFLGGENAENQQKPGGKPRFQIIHGFRLNFWPKNNCE
jgi:hypothetical protein